MRNGLYLKLVCALFLVGLCQPLVVLAADQQRPVQEEKPIVPEPAPVTQLVSPNGGEELTLGSTFTVKWECVTVATEYDLCLSTDNGKSYVAIAEKLGTSGCTYDWKVSASASSSCWLRVGARLNDGRLVYDYSDAPFVISADKGGNVAIKKNKDKPSLGGPAGEVPPVVAPVLRVKTPNGGESYAAGSVVTLNWECEPLAVLYNLYWSHDGGKSYWAIATDLDAGSCKYDWKTTQITSDECLVKVVGKSAINAMIEDVSDKAFQIKSAKIATPIAPTPK